MIESKWIALKPDVIAPSGAPMDADWATEAPSPYDVPTHVRSFYNSATGFLTIEFRYIADEPTSDLTVEPYLVLRIGKRTQRIYALKFDIHSFSRDRKKIAEVATNSISSLSAKTVPTKDITLRAIKSKERTLFEAI